MMADALRERLVQCFPGAAVQVRDLTGGGDHYDVTIEASQFAGLRLLQQHKLVYAALQPELDNGDIHALKLTTRVLPATE